MPDDFLSSLGAGLGAFLTAWRETAGGKLISHWLRPFENFQLSPNDFYDAVERAIGRHQVPGLRFSRVLWKERGILSARRIYFRVRWKQYVWDLCAAPCGTDFFFSTWLVILPRSLTLVNLAGFAATGLIIRYLLWDWLGLIRTAAVAAAALTAILWLLRSGRLEMEERVEEFLLGMTFVGAIWDRFFRPVTYYEIDTAEMFQATTHSALLETIDEVTAVKGLTPLTEAERKPVCREFFGR